MYLIGPLGGFQLIYKSTWATKESQVKSWWFKDEELTKTTRILTFHIITGTLDEMKAKS